MPFTLAHPAAAVPFARLFGKYGVLSALVIGSIAPDLHHLFHVGRSATHSLQGVVVFSLPVGLLCYAVFHLFLKRPLFHLLPESLASRLVPYALRGLPEVPRAGVMLSILVGALTHVGWDALTHGETFGQDRLRFLSGTLFSLDGHPFAFCDALQAGSSLVGVILLGAWFSAWLGRAPRAESAPPAADGRIPLLMALVSFPWTHADAAPGANLLDMVSGLIAAWMNAMVYAALAYACLWHAFRRIR